MLDEAKGWMSVLRFLLILLLLVSFVGFALQNLTPAVSLVFLGWRSPALPLAILILAAIAAGLITGIFIGVLLKLSNFLTNRRARTSIGDQGFQSDPPKRNRSESVEDEFDFEDFESDQDPYGTSGRSYEAQTQARTGTQSGSTYSYSYRDPQESEVRQPQQPVDAEYRVVNPGYQTNKPDAEEDWGFEDDQDEDDWR